MRSIASTIAAPCRTSSRCIRCWNTTRRCGVVTANPSSPPRGYPFRASRRAGSCPLRRLGYWKELRRDQPDLFARACQLEDLLNQRRTVLSKHPVWLTGLNRPLHTIPAAQDMLPGFNAESLMDGLCDNGACFT